MLLPTAAPSYYWPDQSLIMDVALGEASKHRPCVAPARQMIVNNFSFDF